MGKSTPDQLNEERRKTWVKNTLEKIPRGHRILDAGAGEQQYKNFCPHLEYVSQDFAAYKPTEVQNGMQMEQWNYGKLDIISDITEIPEPDASFDALLCTEVLEHIPDPVAAIREFSRLLRPNGKLILTAPFCSMTHFAPYHFSTGFNRYFYEYHLPKAGFAIDEINVNGNYFEYLSQELRRVDHVAMRYTGEKPGRLEYFALKMVRRMVNRFASRGAGSSELMSFGLHVLATKR